MSASVGAAAAVPVVRAGNLANAVRTLKKRNIFVYCADMDGAYCCDTDLTGPIALVVGSEGFGVSPLIKKLCDGLGITLGEFFSATEFDALEQEIQ